MIHPTAVIHKAAKVDSSVEIGPYAVIDDSVEIGGGNVIGPYVHVTGNTVIGVKNRFHAGCVIGDAPQDLKYRGERTGLVIGDNNVFREHATVHRSNRMEENTLIGSGNYFMAHSHVGHNCRVGNEAILANGALLGGHVEVGDRAFISGNCLVHQFVRIGSLSLMQGGSAVSKDVPPFVIAKGTNGICGLNTVGLRRAGVSGRERLELRRLYRRLFLDRTTLKEALEEAHARFQTELARRMIEFIRSSTRGVCFHSGASDSELGSEEWSSNSKVP